MQKDDLKCVLIGRNIEIYNDVAKLVRKIDSTSRFKQVEQTKPAIISTLKKINGPSLIFISDKISFSLEILSDLVWHFSADSIVVIISSKAQTVALKKPFNNTQFSRLKISSDKRQSESTLQFLVQSAREKSEFRRCKSLLGVSEKRCQWLVDSSREAVSFISREMHWYANTAYLELFKIASIQELRTITVKDLIAPDEQQLFDDFIQNQKKLSENKHSIVLSMKKSNGAKFRANVYLIPSVFKGHKCFQLWVRKINSIDNDDGIEQDNKGLELSSFAEKMKSSEAKFLKENNNVETNPFSEILKTNKESKKVSNGKTKINQSKAENNQNNIATSIEQTKVFNSNSLLRGVIKRKEAKIVSTPLNFLNSIGARNRKVVKHQMVSLKVAAAQKQGVDELLTNSPDNFDHKMRSTFWDKVKFSRLLQILIKRDRLNVYLLLRINEASVSDKNFVDWLVPGLKRLGNKSKNLIVLIPSNIDESEYRKTLLFIKKLRKYKCKIALDSFAISESSITLLKYSKPEYVRLSLPWTRQLQGDEAKEIRLSSAIRQLESRDIKVIAPCGYSKDMRKLFVLSGASFCQERVIKTAQ